MTIIAIAAGLIVALLIGRQLLQGGLLLNNGDKFMTHNVRFKKLPTGELHLKATGGLLTDKFDIKLHTSDIDLFAFAIGHRPMNKGLDKAGYKVYRLVHVQRKASPEFLRTTIGDFTLKPSAQNKFERFTSQFVQLEKSAAWISIKTHKKALSIAGLFLFPIIYRRKKIIALIHY